MSRQSTLAQAIAASVPVLNIFRRPEPWPYTLDELGAFPPDSLGREVHRFLTARDLGYLPKYEVHDTYHALLGYGTTVTEELKLQAFMWSNGNATFAGRVLLAIGFLLLPSKWSVLRREMRRGRCAVPLKPIPPASLIPQTLVTLRSELGLL